MGTLEELFRDAVPKLESWRMVDHTGQLESANQLLQRTKGLPIDGIEKLCHDAGSFDKFCALLSEIRFAITFAELGSTVHVLADDAFSSVRGQKGADLLVCANDGYEFLVEVRRGSDGNPNFPAAFDHALALSGLRFEVEFELGEEFGPRVGLSRPGTNWQEREAQEAERTSVIETVLEELRLAAPGASGELRVGTHVFRYWPSQTEHGRLVS